MLMAADEPRKGDLDGRGTLSQAALIDFCAFFLECCLDQVRYMRELLEPSEREALLSGELERGKAPRLIDVSERTARRVISALVEKKLLVSESHKAPRLGFPIDGGRAQRRFPSGRHTVRDI